MKSKDMRHCANCGERITASDKFCRSCGADLSADNAIIWKVDQVELRRKLQSIDDYEFEHLIADLWERLGWTTAVSSASIDAGIDVTATKERPYSEKQLIQVKRYGENTTVGGPAIQQYASLRHQERDADAVVVVTSNSFTHHAEERARELNVKIVDGSDLVAIIEDLNAYDLIEQYVPLESSDQELKREIENDNSQQGFTATNPTVQGIIEDLAPESSTSTTVEKAISEDSSPTEDPLASPEANSSNSNDSGFTDESQRKSHEPESGPSSFQKRSSSSDPLPDNDWKTIVTGCTVGWVALFILGQFLPEAIVGLGTLALWFGLPVAIYMDSREVQEYTDWPNHRWVYILGSFIFFLNVIVGTVYLWRRSQAKRTEPVDSLT